MCCCFICGVKASQCQEWEVHCTIKNLKHGLEMQVEHVKRTALRKNAEDRALKQKQQAEAAKKAEAESRDRVRQGIISRARARLEKEKQSRSPSRNSPIVGRSYRTPLQNRPSNLNDDSDDSDDDDDVINFSPFGRTKKKPSNPAAQAAIGSSGASICGKRSSAARSSKEPRRSKHSERK
jgi:hypothetical protein